MQGTVLLPYSLTANAMPAHTVYDADIIAWSGPLVKGLASQRADCVPRLLRAPPLHDPLGTCVSEFVNLLQCLAEFLDLLS